MSGRPHYDDMSLAEQREARREKKFKERMAEYGTTFWSLVIAAILLGVIVIGLSLAYSGVFGVITDESTRSRIFSAIVIGLVAIFVLMGAATYISIHQLRKASMRSY